MQHEIDFNNLSLYLLKRVIVTFVDGRYTDGILTNVSVATQEVVLGTVAYSIHDISDIEMTGSITYHTYKKTCEIEGLYFELDDFVPDTDSSKLSYGEFNCVGACHLVFTDKLVAKDVRILSYSHKIYVPALTKSTNMYLLNDGAILVGTMEASEGLSIRTANGSAISVNPDDVQDIIRLPLTNEFVEITLKTGDVVSGVVSAANDSMIVVINETVQAVQLTDVLSIRYKGTISIGMVKVQSGVVRQIKISLGVKEEAFLCKLPYFRSSDDEASVQEGALASFVPGVTERGLIAKDVVVESKAEGTHEAEYETGVVVLAPTLNRTIGYIGKEFVTKTYSLITNASLPRGSVSFSAEQLSFRISPRTVYVVRYQCVHDGVLTKAKNIELVESYPVSDYAKIWIDESGAVQKLPVSVLFLDKFVNRAVDIETNDGEQLSGTLTQVGATELTLSDNGGSHQIKTEDILRVFYYGSVTGYQPNSGTGFINGQYWFHVNNFVNPDQIVRLEAGVSVRFTFEVSSKGNMCAAKCIEVVEGAEKKGYVLRYVPKYPGKGFGFIVPPDLLEERLRNNDRSGTIYFRETDIVNPDAFRIDTNKYYYLVTYTEGENNTAHNVKLVEEQVFKAKSAPKQVAAESKRTEVKNISDLVEPTVALAGTEYEYGLINIFSSHNALINPQYFNRTYAPDGAYDVKKSVYFNPEEATVTPDSRLKTAKYAYLARYVRKGTIMNPAIGVEQAGIDYSYPVEVVHTFTKKQCASILLDGEKITIEYVCVDDVTPKPAAAPKATEENDDAPDVMLGESIYFKLKDGSACHGVYSGENDEAYVLSNGTSISKNEVFRLFRFGVITALSVETGTATINNLFDFSLSVAEPKMVSILKNQKTLVRLHVMYSCDEGKITEVCRVSKRCLSCLMWDAGIVTELNKQAHNITIDSSITHYLTVMSDGVNTYVNNNSILDRAVYVKQVFHPYLGNDGMDAEIVAMAVDVRCQEEELKIQYDEGKDVYLGYRNGTVSFPVLGTARELQEKINETIIVTFRIGADMATLEGYVDEDYVEAEELAESDDDHSLAKIQQEALCLLLLQREDVEQLLAGKIHLEADGTPTEDQVQRAVDFLVSQSEHLAAVKVALKYPELDVLANLDNLLRTEIQTRCTAVGLDANSGYGEQAFYLSTALQYPTNARAKGKSSNTKFSNYDYLYRLFSQEFESREHVVKYLQAGNPANKTTLANLFRKPCRNPGELIAHIVLLDKVNLDIVCSLIRGNAQLSDEIIAYAKDIDDMISDQDIAAVIRSVQDRYLRDKRRFSKSIVAMIGTENICDNLKNLIGSMQSRFLRLICREDWSRFERLLEICTDVLDYINKPGFTQQERLLQDAYRDVGLLEEEILKHPCKESAEMLLSSGQFDLTSNILVSLKNEIYALLNRLYQDASKPQIHCRVNETSILPGAKKFWLIVENGGQNENFQSAENLSIELESFTLGFMPQAKVKLPRNKLDCGEQLAVEVEFELSGDVASVLEFGWTARYQFTTEFHSNGNTTRSECQQESDAPLQLQLQLDTTMVKQKDYSVDNPYSEPARGQPLIGKEMFFGRETERKKILESICVDNGEKCFIPGSAVIIHGQKKSGKTSLVNQVKNYIKEDPDLSRKAIFLNFCNILDETGGVEMLHCFKRTFYADIMYRLEDELVYNHPDVVDKMDEIGLEVPDPLLMDSETWAAQCDKFFRAFARMDKGEHNIILFMDEFTILCTTILSQLQQFPEKESLNNIPNFIKTFSQYGFIQIIIGHEAMMRALGTLGVLNHTAEFAETIEISALDDAASRALVTQPMLHKFGYDVYGSELGKQAVERLLDLSGRNPAYLMRLCNKMFMYYTDPQKCPRTQLLISDVNAMVQEYIGELLLSDFDILLMEDGDDVAEAEKRITYHYLKCVALLSLSSYDRRTADSGEVTRELMHDYEYTTTEIEKTRNILEARRVISITNGGRVKINTGLFAEYIQQKNGR